MSNSNETKIFVDLDTAKAMLELRKMEQETEQTSVRMGARVRSALGQGLSAVGLGGAFAAGAHTLRSATESGVGDVMSETFGAYAKQIEEFFLGDLNEDAKASQRAREETISVFGTVAGAKNQIPAGALQYYSAVKGLRLQEERGRELFELDTTRFHGAGMEKVLDRILQGIEKIVDKAAKWLADQFTMWPFN